MIRKRNLGFWLVALALLLPVALAAPRIAAMLVPEPAALLMAGGRLAGIVGLILLLAAGILSVRIPGVDRWFGGLTKLWRLHHWLGGFSLLAVMLHVVLLALGSAALSDSAALELLLPLRDGLATWLGWLALLGMMVFLAPSFHFFGQPGYQFWKDLHRLAAPVAVLSLVHAFLLERSLGLAAPFVWGVLGLGALAALAWRIILSPRRTRRGTITTVDRLTHDVVEITIRDLDRPLSYEAGQFVYFSHEDDALEAAWEEHPFTLSSAPEWPELRIGIKAAGDATRAMQGLQVGTKVRIDGPYGDFFCLPDQAPQLWIAGGIGIAPFIGRARSLAERRPEGLDTRMIYCAENRLRSYYADELEQIAGALPGFDIRLHLFDDEGFLDLDFIRGTCPDFLERQAFVCGPPGLMRHARHLLLPAGLPRSHFHTEDFDLL